MPGVNGPPALELTGITKRFGGVAAVNAVSLSIARGEIHGIVGENGAGKSTLMSIINGMIKADSGDIKIDGKPVRIKSPRDAAALGVGMVHQHFLLVETMSVLDNILLGAEGGALLANGRAALRKKLAALSGDHGLTIDPDALAGDLPVGLRQRVEILKILTRGARILILDEPTAALTPGEAADLFGLMRSLAADGAGMLFITHKLGEALDITDNISALRAGQRVATYKTSAASAAMLAEAMVGRPVTGGVEKAPAAPGRVLLEARDLTLTDADGRLRLNAVTARLRAGEIVGVAGVAGNGQSELLEVLAGLRRASAGTLEICGESVDFARHNPASARARGIAHIPEDRLRQGVVADFSAGENAILGQHRAPRFGARLLDRRAIARHCADLMRRWDVRPATPDLAIGRFSGGNQQKMVFAREAEADPEILLVGQPARGVDIGAIEAIHRRLIDLRGAGKAILLVSAELDEILALSDRVLVMQGGRVVGECAPDAPDARRRIGLLMAGATGRAA